MNRTVLFDASPDTFKKVAESLKEKNEDSLLVLAPIAGSCTVYGPSKKGKNKGYHRLKFEVWIPEDAIKGEDALTDFGITTMMRLPKNRVESHLVNDEKME